MMGASVGYRAPMIGGGMSDHPREWLSAKQREVVAKPDDDIGFQVRCASAPN
jgi:hypothetical protein